MSELARDLVAFAGVALVGIGLWLVHPAAALVVGGGMLFTAALVVMRRR